MYMAGNRQQRQWIIIAAREQNIKPTTEAGLDLKYDLTHDDRRLPRAGIPIPTDFDRWEANRGHPMLSHPQFATDSPEWMAAAGQQRLALLDSSATTGTVRPMMMLRAE